MEDQPFPLYYIFLPLRNINQKEINEKKYNTMRDDVISSIQNVFLYQFDPKFS